MHRTAVPINHEPELGWPPADIGQPPTELAGGHPFGVAALEVVPCSRKRRLELGRARDRSRGEGRQVGPEGVLTTRTTAASAPPAGTQARPIAQLIGRMVRAPLARRVEEDERLNAVDLFLPNYDRDNLARIVA